MAGTRTAVIVLKPKVGSGRPEEILRYPRVELRPDPVRRRIALYRGDTVIGTFSDDDVARWHMEDG